VEILDPGGWRLLSTRDRTEAAMGPAVPADPELSAAE